MKKIIYGVFTTTLVIATLSLAGQIENDNNDQIKKCMVQFGYDYDEPDTKKRMDNFDWASASNCFFKYKQERKQAELEEQREFLKKNPWYKGSNFRWELRAEYNCIKDSKLGEICHKPYYYIN